MSETITAISTAPGEAGIGIVRISGSESRNIMGKLMRDCPAHIEPRHAYFGRVVRDSADPGSELIDEAVFIYMQKPFSYTGEDMLEIQGHGSNVSLKAILSAVLDSGFDGVRMAEPGEFTKLAFLNGKMDLSQAEAVMDIISAKTELSLEIAENQREGRLGEAVKKIRSALLDTLAQMAVDIDYPDEDFDDTPQSYSDIVSQLRWSLSDIEDLLDTASIGRIAREGIRAVIVGRPNAGKSSLMNALLGEGRVIVTDVPGTTRDTVEENASLRGIPIVLIDTAGLRESGDKVEKMGIERTTQAISKADLVILVIDGSRPVDEEDGQVISFIEKMSKDHMLVVINKEDLGRTVTKESVLEKLPGVKIVVTSLVGSGAADAAEKVTEAVSDMFELGSIDTGESNIVTNERHIKLLKNAVINLDEAISALQNGESVETSGMKSSIPCSAGSVWGNKKS